MNPQIPPSAFGPLSVISFMITTELANLLIQKGILSKDEVRQILLNLRDNIEAPDNADVLAIRGLLNNIIQAI